MKRVMVRTGMAVITAAVMLAASASGALAGGGYGAVAGESTGGGTGGGTLPFTGADLAFFAAVGGTMVFSGLLLRRYGARRGDAPACGGDV